MAKRVTLYDLLISCPSDIQEEIGIISEVIEEFNRLTGDMNNISLVAKHWSKDSYAESGGKPQQLLNKQFVLDCDAAIAVFGTRFGTPTDYYESGTEEEIEELLKEGKQIFLYFSDKPKSIEDVDFSQYEKVKQFKEKYKDKGIYFTYKSNEEFKKLLYNHLTLHFLKVITKEEQVSSNASNLQIKGVNDGAITENAQIKTFNFNTVDEKQLQQLILLKEEIESIEIEEPDVEDEVPENVLRIGGFRNIEYERIDNDVQEVINNFFIAHGQVLTTDFYHVPGVYYQNMFGTFFGQKESVTGPEENQRKYNLIHSLYFHINKYNQWQEYFESISKRSYLEMALSNQGTHFDEDCDIKLFLTKGSLCTHENLPLPGNEILVRAKEFLDLFFKPEESLEIDEYTDYPDYVEYTHPMPGIRSYDERIEDEKYSYQRTLENLFHYDYHEHKEYDVIRFKVEYIKQNTNMYFPSYIILNFPPEKILYEITSKHHPHVVKGIINLNQSTTVSTT